MQDLTLDFQNKTISNSYLKGKTLILQKVQLALQCWTGDWFLDGDFGISYDLRLDSKGLLLADMREVILSVEGVKSVQDLKMETTQRDGQLVFIMSTTVITKDEEAVVYNGLVPIIGV